MRNYTVLLITALLMLAGNAFAQLRTDAVDLFFSEYVEGSSNNKAIEIFNGTGAAVDLSQYTVKLASNGGAWSTTNIITLTGTLANNDVYVIANSAASAAILAVSDVTSTVTYFNGDDALGLFKNAVLLDIFGVYQNDPGTAWPVAGVADATLNHTLIRKPTVIQGVTDWALAAGTNADDSQYIVQPIDYITNLGTHLFTPGGGNNTATPTFDPAGGTFSAPVNVTISCTTPAAVIYYTTDGTTPTISSTVYTTPVNISATTTLKAMAKAPAMDPSYVATAAYTFPVIVQSLTALRNSPADGTTLYYLSGESYLTFKQTFRNQKYFQDEAAGILIDDLNGVITTPLNVGDGVEGILGKISEYGGMLQFVPTANITSVTSTENPIIPVPVTYTDLIANFDTYESRVVKVANVSFSTPTGNFANGITYPSFDPNDDYLIRTTFYDVDYIGTAIPTIPMHVTGIPNSRTDGAFFTPRSLADFEMPTGDVATPAFDPAGGLYFAPQSVTITCATAGATIHYTIDGNDPTEASSVYSAPLTVSTNTTLKAKAYLGNLSSTINSASYSFPVSVQNLTELRGQSTGSTVFRLANPVQLTYQQTYRHQKFVQDGVGLQGAGILIDDLNGVITGTYLPGDMIPNLTGTLTEYGNMLELIPVANPGPAVSNQPLVPVHINLLNLLNQDNFEQVESRLVILDAIHFSEPGANFASGQLYNIEDANGSFGFRTNFYDADYIGTPIPAGVGAFIGIPNSRTDGNYFTSRSLSDLIFYHAPDTFTAVSPTAGTVQLNWSWTAGVPAYVTGYVLYRNDVELDVIPNPATTTYQDTNTVHGTSYTYGIAPLCWGMYEMDPVTVTITPSPNDDPTAPVVLTELKGNYPNPFNPLTTISFSVKDAGPVWLGIYNSRGQLVKTLVDMNKAGGNYSVQWDGTDFSGRSLSSGVYFYKMHAGSYSSTRKMILMK
ncbi:MAG TPA: chitobiase/beta-hexosaminidase C-terminal domain-containing protein [Candidatus Cloacimonadota bacterium]|nr:chitobiase/beta-hexosaminidase C-terminal domain-containing protein [Candidatus Cloacimonadota bacterium]